MNIKPECWKAFKHAGGDEGEAAYQALVDAGIEYDTIQTQQSAGNITSLPIAGMSGTWNDYQTMRIANGMCGIPYSLEDVEAAGNEEKTEIEHANDASNSMTNPGGGEDQLSVTYWMSPTNTIPTICAYAGKDPIVGINQFATLQHAMETNGMVKGTDYEFFYFPNSGHQDITAEKEPTVYPQFIGKITEWLEV